MNSYTVAQAARRTGLSEQSIRKKADAGHLRWVSESGARKRVGRAEVERLRLDRLSRFDDVLDLSLPPSGGSVDRGASSDAERKLRERVATLESQLRLVAESRAVTGDGIQNLLRGEQGLLDAVIAGIELDGPALGRGS